ncbi:hypothetical protein K450DRAFT_229355 [Umbelopsis ramanniana AG]|uniref:Uncharacterized protein n=1 Tax=Umbelopsis ramanniana AG TaxID=1314678 RepID=A0AAD5EEX8_UMBRA|nr:uncharacterized protein K450DRAFT_229355 [Umbelopsis ramanniana AG]KAI8582172.1 hypothetical protein K450DRAFT_229355 [Umbelopsis ramanniana AG]
MIALTGGAYGGSTSVVSCGVKAQGQLALHYDSLKDDHTPLKFRGRSRDVGRFYSPTTALIALGTFVGQIFHFCNKQNRLVLRRLVQLMCCRYETY